MSDLTPEKLAELRRLLDATETPWALWDGYGPDGNGDMRVARIGHLSGSGIRADPDSADIYGRREAFELLASAVNALPALLDAAAERDELAAKVERVRELHKSSGDAETQGYTGLGYGYISPYCMGEVASDEYGVPWPCETIRAIDGAES